MGRFLVKRVGQLRGWGNGGEYHTALLSYHSSCPKQSSKDISHNVSVIFILNFTESYKVADDVA